MVVYPNKALGLREGMELSSPVRAGLQIYVSAKGSRDKQAANEVLVRVARDPKAPGNLRFRIARLFRGSLLWGSRRRGTELLIREANGSWGAVPGSSRWPCIANECAKFTEIMYKVFDELQAQKWRKT
jgi:hypothetical protein